MAFLRGYGPINRIEGMFAETLPAHARKHGIAPIQFAHPRLACLLDAIDPAAGRLTNVVLTGTAGDGKTTLCHELWSRFGGSDHRTTGNNRDNYLALEVDTPGGPKRLHFIFEFSGWSPEKDQAWRPEQLELLDLFARSVCGDATDDYFIIAANDGRLVHAWDSLPDCAAKGLADVFEELLATDRDAMAGHKLLFLNLSRMPTKELLEHALDALLVREEWRCFEREIEDPAFSPTSPLTRNFLLLKEPAIRARLLALADLIDANGLHVPIREILLLLVNALLGCPSSKEHVATIEDLRLLTEEGRSYEAALYGNLFGANLPERRRERLSVYRHLGGFRIGHETSNLLDSLIIFGTSDPTLQAEHKAYLASDLFYGENAEFEGLRRAYLEAEDERTEGAHAFIKALVNERRRLFFRLPEDDERLDPWKLSVFPSAGSYQRQVLEPLRQGQGVDPIIIQRLVCGLNRIWTGMLAGDLDRLYLSTGLDLSSAKVSEIFLYEVPLRRNLHGVEVTVSFRDEAPHLEVKLDNQGHGAAFKLHLVRYEFLMRVAQGALPSSFSKECNEDVLAFKSQVLSQYLSIAADDPNSLSVLTLGPRGTLSPHELGVRL